MKYTQKMTIFRKNLRAFNIELWFLFQLKQNVKHYRILGPQKDISTSNFLQISEKICWWCFIRFRRFGRLTKLYFHFDLTELLIFCPTQPLMNFLYVARKITIPQTVCQKTLVWVKSPKIFSTVAKFVGSEVDDIETLQYRKGCVRLNIKRSAKSKSKNKISSNGQIAEIKTKEAGSIKLSIIIEKTHFPKIEQNRCSNFKFPFVDQRYFLKYTVIMLFI